MGVVTKGWGLGAGGWGSTIIKKMENTTKRSCQLFNSLLAYCMYPGTWNPSDSPEQKYYYLQSLPFTLCLKLKPLDCALKLVCCKLHNCFSVCFSKVFALGRNIQRQKIGQFIQPASQPFISAPNGTDHLHNSAIPQDEPRTPTTPQSNNHIAFHLVSKVLEDESVFNFPSVEETTPGLEPFSFNHDG